MGLWIIYQSMYKSLLYGDFDTIKETAVYLIACLLLYLFVNKFYGNALFKFTHLATGEQREKIQAFSYKMKFPIKKIYVMNASKRNTKPNAYFIGFGKRRIIVLYDTLLEKLSADEAVAIFAHEIGHAKKRHSLILTLIREILAAAAFILSLFVVFSPQIAIAFGFDFLDYMNVWAGISVCFALSRTVLLAVNIPLNALRRKLEYQADKFAAEKTDRDTFVSALKKPGTLNYSNLAPHPFVVFMTYGHPTLARRIEALEKT